MGGHCIARPILGQRSVCGISHARMEGQMISTGHPGDSDPLAELPTCPECGIWLTQDLFDDWICEDCDAKQKNEEPT
jgi:hypothetical protein